MKLLHVSDWHLGCVLYNESRSLDHEVVLNEIVNISREERPDLIVHSGDLFQHRRPSIPDQLMAITVLQELKAVAPIVVICGNHDSPALFRLFSRLLGPDSGIYFIDRPRDPDAGGVLHFSCRDGTAVRLGVLPFVHANEAVDAFDDIAHRRVSYADRIARMEQAIAAELFRDFDQHRDVAIFAAHFHVHGAHFTGSERPRHTSDYYATRDDDIPTVNYAAFGHIHKPQALPGNRLTGRYAGSPIQIDFGELHERKSVVLADLRPGQPAQVDTIALSGGRGLWRFEGTLNELRSQAPAVGNKLCLLTVHNSTHEPTLSEQIRDLLPQAVLLPINEVCSDRKLEILTHEAVSADTEPDMRQFFHEYLSDRGSMSLPAELLMSTFSRVLTAVEEQRMAVFDEETVLSEPTEQQPTEISEAS